MPKPFSQDQKDFIGNRLLEQGYRQFSTLGLRKTSVEELARAAGISKGAFYSFYDSKESLFMDIVELAENRFREAILSSIDQPGSSPRARLFMILKKAFSLWKEMPILHLFTLDDFELLRLSVSPEKIHEHLSTDQVFVQELVDRCRESGIPIKARIEDIQALFIALFLTSLHETDWISIQLPGSMDLLLEIVAAFCLGEIDLQVQAFEQPHTFLTQEQ